MTTPSCFNNKPFNPQHQAEYDCPNCICEARCTHDHREHLISILQPHTQTNLDRLSTSELIEEVGVVLNEDRA